MTLSPDKRRAEECSPGGSEVTCHLIQASPTSSSEETGEKTAFFRLLIFSSVGERGKWQSRTWISNWLQMWGSVVTPMCPRHVGYPKNLSKVGRHDTGSTGILLEKQQKARRVSGYPRLLKWHIPTLKYLNPAQHCSEQHSLTVAGTLYGWWWKGMGCHSLTALLSMLWHFPNGKTTPGGRTLQDVFICHFTETKHLLLSTPAPMEIQMPDPQGSCSTSHNALYAWLKIQD